MSDVPAPTTSTPPAPPAPPQSNTATINPTTFHTRCTALHKYYTSHPTIFANASAITIHRGAIDEAQPYAKSSCLQLFMMGFDVPDLVMVLTLAGDVFFLGTKKKMAFLAPLLPAPAKSPLKIHFLERNKEDGNVANFATILKDIPTLGGLLKDTNASPFIDTYTAAVGTHVSAPLSDITPAISAFLSVKDETEFEVIKKAAVLTNKIFKQSFVPEMERIIDEGKKVSHEKIAEKVHSVLEDPSLIKLKVPASDVEACFFPIVQSGGDYDLKVSAQSSTAPLKFDVILCSIGARYQNYCSAMSRTYLVDPPPKVSKTYELLLEMQDACLAVMKPGNPLSMVYDEAVSFLTKINRADLVTTLPKNLGFAIGLDFRDGNLLLNSKNKTMFRARQVYNLSVGFHNIPLSEADVASVSGKSDIKKLKKYSLQVADTYVVKEMDVENGNDMPELLTKASKNAEDVVYTINEKGDDDSSSDDDDDSDDSASVKDAVIKTADGGRKSSRQAAVAEAGQGDIESAAQRMKSQAELLKKKNEQRLREIARKNRKGGDNDVEEEAQELTTYPKTEDYPDTVLPNQVKVDMRTECVLLPICGNPVPFHISTVKNVVLPDPDRATYLRINFHTAGAAIGKDVPMNLAKLIEKHSPYASFIREMTFRSLDSTNLTQAYRQIMELRKRVKQREQKEQEESDLVEQSKLIRLKDGKIPRLIDLTMRPVFGGRKTIGTLEAHENGLRFRSNRGEQLDIIYDNIKNALFQPCEKEIMVLVHFNLKNPIMIGKKKHENVQFFTEVVEASEQIDGGRKSMYDPDEMDEEQRQRQLRKKLNEAFKEFCKKVEGVSKKFNASGLEFDIPYRDLGFNGTPHKEMVFIQPTVNCLVNLTETPFFCVDLEKVDHVHFERVSFTSKAFDIVLINKDFAKQPWRTDMIDNKDKDSIQEWLTDMEIPYTEGPMNLNWKQIMNTVVQDDRFYEDTEEDETTPKDPGWSFLSLNDEEGGGDEDEEEDDSEFSDAAESESEVPSSDDSESDFDEDESDSDANADEELEEEGMDWEDMEKEAELDDKRRAREARDEEQGASKKKQRR